MFFIAIINVATCLTQNCWDYHLPRKTDLTYPPNFTFVVKLSLPNQAKYALDFRKEPLRIAEQPAAFARLSIAKINNSVSLLLQRL